MAILASTFVEGTITDTQGFVTEIDSITNTSTAGVISHLRLALASGANTILIPTGAKGVIITFSADANTKTLKGVTGDTGIVVSTGSLARTFPLLFGSGVATSFVITSSGLDVGLSEFFFF